jgi:four helix bundle protein
MGKSGSERNDLALTLSHAPALALLLRMKPYFDHERLNVYQVSLAFNAWVGELLRLLEAKAAAKDQLDRAATSIPLNIAEGNGKFSKRDRARFFDIARGSALEAAASSDVLVSRKLIAGTQVISAKEQLVQIVNMLMGLLKGLGYDFEAGTAFVREEAGSSKFEQEQEREKE